MNRARNAGRSIVTASFPDDLRAAILRCAEDMSGGALTSDRISFVLKPYARAPRLADPGRFDLAGCVTHRAEVPVYPASVVKLFHLYELCGLEAEGRLVLTDEDRRAARAMIEISSNEATAYLVGRMSGAFDGPWCDAATLAEFTRARHSVQAWFEARRDPDFAGISVLHATYEDSPYGAAKQIREGTSGNRLTARAGAALLHDIVRGAAAGSAWMMSLLDRSAQRAAFASGGCPPEGDQVRGFLGEGLAEDVKVWAKAGHTSWTRHDLLYGELGETGFILSVMTDSHWSADDTTFLPEVARLCLAAFRAQSECPA
ncbi:hypothetical protein EOW65_09290 [Sinirhodobacter ferrireducens]|uniref:Serine hydrolase n=2 Tax=Paenirhodobacter ferrireducens TaxID=1215032 RepID=A0A443LHZ6_9RHOB|nr:hypothetical protein EOW65_09290 [Sinirhodobacter ferrireducens]